MRDLENNIMLLALLRNKGITMKDIKVSSRSVIYRTTSLISTKNVANLIMKKTKVKYSKTWYLEDTPKYKKQ